LAARPLPAWKLNALSKWHPPACTPDIELDLAHISKGRLGLRRIAFMVSSLVRSSLPWLFSLVDVVASTNGRLHIPSLLLPVADIALHTLRSAMDQILPPALQKKVEGS
jgi:hypothetical protein